MLVWSHGNCAGEKQVLVTIVNNVAVTWRSRWLLLAIWWTTTVVDPQTRICDAYRPVGRISASVAVTSSGAAYPVVGRWNPPGGRVTARSEPRGLSTDQSRTDLAAFPSVNQAGSVRWRGLPMTSEFRHVAGVAVTDGSRRSSDASYHNDTARMRVQKKARQIRDQRPHQRQPSQAFISDVVDPSSHEFHKCWVSVNI